jgi:hypothetical protein
MEYLPPTPAHALLTLLPDSLNAYCYVIVDT